MEPMNGYGTNVKPKRMPENIAVPVRTYRIIRRVRVNGSFSDISSNVDTNIITIPEINNMNAKTRCVMISVYIEIAATPIIPRHDRYAHMLNIRHNLYWYIV